MITYLYTQILNVHMHRIFEKDLEYLDEIAISTPTHMMMMAGHVTIVSTY